MIAGTAGAAFPMLKRTLRQVFAVSRARGHLRAAEGLITQGRLAEAVSRCREAVALAPWMGDARNDLGVALMAVGDARAAEDEFLAATRASPTCAAGYL